MAFAPNVKSYLITQPCVVVIAHLWKQKHFCANCRVHCYKPEMRERIKTVMHFSGPRMLLYYPLATIRHLIESIKENWRNRNEFKKDILDCARLR